MRLASCVVVAMVAGSVCCGAPARADHGPLLIVPGRPDVPVLINGYDASWSVVEGDWGLYRAGHGALTVTFPDAVAVPYERRHYYFPASGKRQRYGRVEILPPANRRLPRPAESFHRVWSTYHGATETHTEYPAYDPPPVIVTPRMRSKN